MWKNPYPYKSMATLGHVRGRGPRSGRGREATIYRGMDSVTKI